MKLAPQPFRLLTMLASHAGQIVSREEIQEQLWGEETYVDFEQGVNHCVKQIRTVLSDNADNPLYVETLPRRGYRFLAPVVSKNVPAPGPRIIESTSGIQSRVLPEPTQVGEGADLPAPHATHEAEVVASREASASMHTAPAYSAQATAREEDLAPRKITSAAAAAEALAPEIERLRKSSARTHRGLVWLAIILVLLVVGGLLWYGHRP